MYTNEIRVFTLFGILPLHSIIVFRNTCIATNIDLSHFIGELFSNSVALCKSIII